MIAFSYDIPWVLGMLPSFKKSATPNETDEWRRQRRLGMHHACIKHVVESTWILSITFVGRMCMCNVHIVQKVR